MYLVCIKILSLGNHALDDMVLVNEFSPTTPPLLEDPTEINAATDCVKYESSTNTSRCEESAVDTVFDALAHDLEADVCKDIPVDIDVVLDAYGTPTNVVVDPVEPELTVSPILTDVGLLGEHGNPSLGVNAFDGVVQVENSYPIEDSTDINAAVNCVMCGSSTTTS